MFRVKASPADTVNFCALFFAVLTRKTGRLFFQFRMQNAECKNSFRFVFASITLVSIALVGCQTFSNSVAVTAEPSSPIRPMRIVTDDLDRKVSVPAEITRVVSTAPSVTEMIFAVGSGDRLVGVTTFCNYPEEAKPITKIGDTLNPNIETIIALKPDVVFVSTASQIEAFAKTMEQNGIAVYVTDPASLDDVLNNLIHLADLFGTGERAGQSVPDLKRRIGAVWEKVEVERRVRVLVQISREPLFTIGKQSYLNTIIEKAGGESVTANFETAYPKLSKETALALQPEVIILAASDDNREANEVFNNSPAVKNGRVYSIDADILSRPGPRLVDALEQIARLLHPEKFRTGF